ncbi:hypothetical protein FHG87_015598 [Trinorchestia longiramus]|nr:hypothetical protein FHG87_015598 [Trinorchestia longiramus]
MDDDDDQSSESEFFFDKSDESLQDSSSSDDSYEEEEADDLLDDENFDDSTNSVAPAMQPNWKLVSASTRSFPFTGKEEMCLQPTIDPENGKPKPIDLFNLFISDDVVNHIEREEKERCLGCYEKLSSNENCQVARNKARRVTTYCNLCESKPHLCVSCFSEKHGNI